MTPIKLITLFFLTAVCARAASAEDLYGTWRLRSFTTREATSGKSLEVDRFGPSPHGFLSYSRDGRMYAIIVTSQRPKPADLTKMTDEERLELFKTVIAYAGTFTFDGKVATHNVDISWNGNWTGTAQIRNVQLEGRILTITTNGQPSAVDGKPIIAVLTWEKMP